MGAYQLFRIEFEGREARDTFEKINFKDNDISKPRRLFQYKNESDYYTKGHQYECTYYMGWDGYALAEICLDILKEAKILNKIKSFKSFDLSVGDELFDNLKRYTKK